MTKEELREIIGPMFAQLEIKIDNLQSNHGKEITRLDKQSNEHYDNARVLEDKITDRMELVKQLFDASSHSQGERLGRVEIDIAAGNVCVENLATDIAEIRTGGRWGKEMWIIIAVAAGAPFLAKLIELL